MERESTVYGMGKLNKKSAPIERRKGKKADKWRFNEKSEMWKEFPLQKIAAAVAAAALGHKL